MKLHKIWGMGVRERTSLDQKREGDPDLNKQAGRPSMEWERGKGGGVCGRRREEQEVLPLACSMKTYLPVVVNYTNCYIYFAKTTVQHNHQLSFWWQPPFSTTIVDFMQQAMHHSTSKVTVNQSWKLLNPPSQRIWDGRLEGGGGGGDHDSYTRLQQ